MKIPGSPRKLEMVTFIVAKKGEGVEVVDIVRDKESEREIIEKLIPKDSEDSDGPGVMGTWAWYDERIGVKESYLRYNAFDGTSTNLVCGLCGIVEPIEECVKCHKFAYCSEECANAHKIVHDKYCK